MEPTGGEIAGTVAALAISFTLRSTGPDGLAEILRRIGAERVDELLNQPDLWIPYDEARAAADAAAEICRDDDIGYRLGEEAARVLHEQGRLTPFRGRGSGEVIAVMTGVLADANRVRQMRSQVVGDGDARLEAEAIEYGDDRFLCRFVVGFLTALPAHLGRTGVAVETDCISRGADLCRFTVNWNPTLSADATPQSDSLVPNRAGFDELDGATADDAVTDIADLLEVIVNHLALPHHALGVRATIRVGADEFTHHRGAFDADRATTFTARVDGFADMDGTVEIAFHGRGLPAIDRYLVESCARQIGATIHDATAFSALRARARQDPLTGLANRALLEERASQIDEGTAVVFVDLDGFKAINDEHGHTVGDALLVQIGDRLRDAVRTSDLVARYGGDEFVALLAGTRSTSDAEAVAEKLMAAFDTPFAIGDTTLCLRGSWGIARVPDDGSSLSELVTIADARMYAAKSRSAHPRD